MDMTPIGFAQGATLKFVDLPMNMTLETVRFNHVPVAEYIDDSDNARLAIAVCNRGTLVNGFLEDWIETFNSLDEHLFNAQVIWIAPSGLAGNRPSYEVKGWFPVDDSRLVYVSGV